MTLLERHEALIKACFETEYYPNKLYDLLAKSPTPFSTDKQIIEFWNDFWLVLPDTPAIRKSPLFYEICNIAEMIFGEEPNWGGIMNRYRKAEYKRILQLFLDEPQNLKVVGENTWTEKIEHSSGWYFFTDSNVCTFYKFAGVHTGNQKVTAGFFQHIINTCTGLEERIIESFYGK